MDVCRKIWVVAVLATVGTLSAANLCTWTGGAGDGKWSSAANWDTPPVSGANDIVAFRSDSELTIENDVEGFSVGGIVLSGTGTKTLSGKTIALAGNYIKAANNGGTANARSYAISNASPTIIAADLNCVGDSTLLNAAVLDPATCSAVVNGNISIAAGKVFRVGDAYAYGRDTGVGRNYTFNGEISGPEGTVQFSNWGRSQVYLNGSVDVQKIAYDYAASAICLPAAPDRFRIRSGTFDLWYGHIFFRVADTFGDHLPVLTWNAGNSYYDQNRSSFNLRGFSQTIDRLGTGVNKSDAVGNHVMSDDPATLTMKATADSSTYGIIRGKVSLVWDPVDDYTLTFLTRTSDTSGSLSVKRGTVALSGTAALPNVPSLDLAAGTAFVMGGTGTATRPLKSMTKIAMGENARFEVAGDITASCVSDAVSITMPSSARFVLPAGFSQTVKLMVVDGEPLSPGTYTGSEGTVGTKIAQITGAGTLVVAGDTTVTFWQGAASADWNTAANWSDGIPSGSLDAIVAKYGTYAISVDETPAASVGNLEMDVRNGRATLNVNAPMAFADSQVNLGTNAVLAVGEGVTLSYACRATAADSDEVFAVGSGAEFRVDGGSIVSSNLYGRIAAKPGSKIVWNNATIDLAPPPDKTVNSVLTSSGATLAMTNSQVTLGYNFNDASNLGTYSTMTVGGGSTLLLHNTHLRLDQWFWGHPLGTVEAVLSGNSHFDMHHYDRAAFDPDRSGETCHVVLRDSAKISGPQEFGIGDGTVGGTTIVEVASPAARIQSFSGFQIGCKNGYGELSMTAGYVEGGGSYGLNVGYTQNSGGSVSANGENPTGMVRVAGGVLNPKGIYNSRKISGFTIGNGVNGSFVKSASVTSHYTGFVELSGEGVISNANAQVLVGAGYGFGRLTQTGGTFLNQTRFPTVVGFCGGEGEWIQSGGTASFQGNVWVGGASTNQIGQGGWNSVCSNTRKNARGRLEASGGTFVTDADLIVSADGAGTVVLSENGSVTAQNIVLTNTVDSANGKTYAAHMVFKMGETGTGVLTAKSELRIYDGTILEVDISNFTNTRKSLFPLIRCQTCSGDFADIQITGGKSSGQVVKFAEAGRTGYWYCAQRGTMFIFR